MDADDNGQVRILNCLHRSHFGGAQWRVVWVGEALMKCGFHTTALFPANADVEYERFLAGRPFPYARVKMHYLRTARRVADNLRYFLDLPLQLARLIKLIRQDAIDIVHVNGSTNLGPVLAATLARRPVIWHWNDTMVPRFLARMMAQLLRLPDCWLVAASSAVIEHYPLDAFKSRYLGVVPPPVLPFDRSEPSDTEAHGRDPVVGFVSNLVPAKGTHEYIATVAALAAEGVFVRGIMVGGTLSGQEDHEREVRALIERNGLSDRIELVGYRFDVDAVMSGLDVLLFPSHSEAAPIVVTQALQQGLALVATDVGNVREVVEGLDVPVVAVGDVPAMVQGVKRALALTAEEKRTFGEQARARVRANFSLERIVARHREIYDHALRARRARRSSPAGRRHSPAECDTEPGKIVE